MDELRRKLAADVPGALAIIPLAIRRYIEQLARVYHLSEELELELIRLIVDVPEPRAFEVLEEIERSFVEE